jgi:hypothetical protein
MQAFRHLTSLRHDVRNRCIGNLPLCPDEPLRHRRFGHQERAGDFSRVEPTQGAKREGYLSFERQRRVAAREDEPQSIVGDLGRELRLAGRDVSVGCIRLELSGEHFFPSDPVDRDVSRGPNEPRARVFRDALGSPLVHGSLERLLGGVFRNAEISGETDYRRQHSPPIRSINGGNLDVGACEHGR